MYQVTQEANFLNLSLSENYISFCKQDGSLFENLNRYPDINLYKKLESEAGKLYGVDSSKVLCTNGSDDGIFLLQQVFAKKSILITDPTFTMYENYAKNLKLDVIKQKLDDNLQIDVDLLISNIEKYNPCLTFIPNPNTPTGTMLPLSEIEKILKIGNNIVIDEAYIEFSNKDSAVKLLDKYPNLIILRTLSKFYGCAGLRVGFIISHNIVDIKKFQAPFSISTPNAFLGFKTIEFVNTFPLEAQNFLETFQNDRNNLLNALRNIYGITNIYKTDANFVLLKIQEDRFNNIIDNFNKERILVKDFSNTLNNTIRIGVGNEAINTRIINCLNYYTS